MERELDSSLRIQQDGKIPFLLNICSLLLFGILILFFSSGCSQVTFQANGSAEEFISYLDQHVPVLLDQYQIPGVSIALIRKGKLVWSGAFGYANLNVQQPMMVDSICRVESISKSVTAWGVMRLVEQGRIDLDDPIQNYLGDFALPNSKFTIQEITVRSLLSQTSGISLGTIGEEYPPQSPLPSLREYLAHEIDVINEPGAVFVYSNTNYDLLELLIEEVTDQEFSLYMTEQVLEPLGMHNSSYVWQEQMIGAIPTGYELKGNPVPPYVYPAKGSGGLFATVEDIARFVTAGMETSRKSSNPVLKEESIQEMYLPMIAIPGLFGFVADDYGFGHFIESLPNGREAVWQGGQGHGWMTNFHAVPETGDGIVILTNSQRSWPFIAKLLNDWADWTGIGSVKMGIITPAATALKVLGLLISLTALWIAVQLTNGLHSGARTFAPFSHTHLAGRIFQTTLGICGIAVLGWRAAQPYSYVSSIFPGTASWAGISLLGLALLLITSAMFPRRE